jgi:hypothetical protein
MHLDTAVVREKAALIESLLGDINPDTARIYQQSIAQRLKYPEALEIDATDYEQRAELAGFFMSEASELIALAAEDDAPTIEDVNAELPPMLATATISSAIRSYFEEIGLRRAVFTHGLRQRCITLGLKFSKLAAAVTPETL